MKIIDKIINYFIMTPEKLRERQLVESELALEKAQFAYENAEADITLFRKRIARMKAVPK